MQRLAARSGMFDDLMCSRKNQTAKIDVRSVNFTQSGPDIIPSKECWQTDKHATWYSRQEYKVINLRRNLTLNALKKAKFDVSKLDQNKYCCSGLEQMQSTEHIQHYKARQKAVVQAVLSEQQYQKLVGSSNAEALRLVSQTFTSFSAQIALERAESFVRDILESKTSNIKSDDTYIREKIATSFVEQKKQPSDDNRIHCLDDISASSSPLLVSRKRPRMVSLEHSPKLQR